jgi:hypothetical protein
MSEQDQTYRKAWNPLTFRGLAVFATSKLPRLFLVAFSFSLIIFIGVVWFVSKNYAPVVVQAVQQLPDTGRLENREIKGINERIQGETKFLALTLDTKDLSDTGSADVQIAIDRTGVWVCSGISSSWGCLSFDLPSETVDLSRLNVQPWWGARQPIIIAIVGVLFLVVTFVILSVLAFILMWLPKFVAYFADRKLTLKEAWRLAFAAQLPGIIVMGAAIVLYGTQAMGVLGVGVFYVLHILVDIVYLFGAVFFLPRVVEPIRSNPFGSSTKNSA